MNFSKLLWDSKLHLNHSQDVYIHVMKIIYDNIFWGEKFNMEFAYSLLWPWPPFCFYQLKLKPFSNLDLLGRFFLLVMHYYESKFKINKRKLRKLNIVGTSRLEKFYGPKEVERFGLWGWQKNKTFPLLVRVREVTKDSEVQ